METTYLTKRQYAKYQELCKEYAKLRARGDRRDAAVIAHKINRMGLSEPEMCCGYAVETNHVAVAR